MALAGLQEHADDVRALRDERAGRRGRRVVELTARRMMRSRVSGRTSA